MIEQIKLWNVATGEDICSTAMLEGGGWIVSTPECRFDTDQDLDRGRGMHWIASDDPLRPLPLEAFMRHYFEPNVLARVTKCKIENTCDREFKPLPRLGAVNRVQPKVLRPRSAVIEK